MTEEQEFKEIQCERCPYVIFVPIDSFAGCVICPICFFKNCVP
jgi:hypothetical protein